MEFLLLGIFDTAWRTLLRTDNCSTFIEAVGGDKFKAEVRGAFILAVRESAAIACNKCFSDLNSEVSKVIPCEKTRPSVSGMAFACPDAAADVGRRVQDCAKVSDLVKSMSEQVMGDIFTEDFSSAVLGGIRAGISLLATVGVIDLLLLDGLRLVKSAFKMASQHLYNKKNKKKSGLLDKNKSEPGPLDEDVDEHLLGFACAIYAHFLPRFISTIDARMRSDIWASVKDKDYDVVIAETVVESAVMKKAKSSVTSFRRQIQRLKKRRTLIEEAHGMVPGSRYAH